jgi:hypothetical protein
MPAGRKIEDEKEARRCLTAATHSGATMRDWARAQGIDGRSLRAWAINLGRRGARAASARQERKGQSARSGLVELVPVGSRSVVASTARYVLEVAGGRVEFGDDASVVTLRRVLEALRSC